MFVLLSVLRATLRSPFALLTLPLSAPSSTGSVWSTSLVYSFYTFKRFSIIFLAARTTVRFTNLDVQPHSYIFLLRPFLPWFCFSQVNFGGHWTAWLNFGNLAQFCGIYRCSPTLSSPVISNICVSEHWALFTTWTVLISCLRFTDPSFCRNLWTPLIYDLSFIVETCGDKNKHSSRSPQESATI